MGKAILNNNSGSTLIMVMMSVAISSIVILSTMALFNSQFTQQKRLAQKYEAMDLQNLLLTAFANGNTCLGNMSPLATPKAITPLSANQFAPISYTTIKFSNSPSAETLVEKDQKVLNSTTGLVADAISFTNIQPTGNPNEFSGQLEIAFKASGLVTPLKPASIHVVVLTNGGAPNTIVGCRAASDASQVTAASLCEAMGGTYNAAQSQCMPALTYSGWDGGFNGTANTLRMVRNFQSMTDAQIAANCPAGTRVASKPEVSREIANLAKFGRTLGDTIGVAPTVPLLVANTYINGAPDMRFTEAPPKFSVSMYEPSTNSTNVYELDASYKQGAPILCISNKNPPAPNVQSYTLW